MARSDYIHRVRFDNPGQPVADGDGGYTLGYAPIVDLWYASIRPASARDFEYATAGTITATSTHVIEADFHPGVDVQTRVVKLLDESVFEVESIQNLDERNVTMSLFCREHS